MSRADWTRGLLWLAVFGWAIGLGAKIFDLVVLGSAWGASPPASLALMPYGAKYPINPGTFFQPLSALMLLPTVGALISGWKTPLSYRVWLLIPVLAFLVIWIFTPTVFWPMIRELYYGGTGKLVRTPQELAAVVHRWFVWDSARILMIAVGFYASVRALTFPYPRATT